MDYVRQRLSDTEARGIADNLLKAFGILYKAVPMKLTTSIEGGRQVITRVFYDIENPTNPRIEKGIVNYKDFNEWHMDNVYELFWRRPTNSKWVDSVRKFEITIYSCPEDCGYFSVLPNYEDFEYTLCIVQEKKRNTIKHEICFGFDSRTGAFLELFDIDLYSGDGIIYKSEDSIESQLQGRILF